MKFRLSPLRTAALVAASLFLAPQGMAADAQNGIVVYNAQHENLVKSWVDGFTKETGIKVTLRNGDDSELGNQLVQEGSASPADVFLTENSPSMVLVDNAKLFARWMPPPCSRFRRSTVRSMGAGSALPRAAPFLSTTRRKLARRSCRIP